MCFLLSNWIGFFLSFCLATLAGAQGGMGPFQDLVFLIKWVLIVRFSTYFPGYFDGQHWLWWVFLVLGFFLFLRGFVSHDARNFPSLALLSFVCVVHAILCL